MLQSHHLKERPPSLWTLFGRRYDLGYLTLNSFSPPPEPLKTFANQGRDMMEFHSDVPIYARVRHIEKIDPNLWRGDRSNEVNDYLSNGWILLNTGTEASTGDSGPYSWVYYVVGWIGEGEPEVPLAHPLPRY
jgi:hypothetical protein